MLWTLAGDGTGRFKAGDFIKFASHDKVYMIVADQSDIQTGSTVTIEPPLITALADHQTSLMTMFPLQYI